MVDYIIGHLAHHDSFWVQTSDTVGNLSIHPHVKFLAAQKLIFYGVSFSVSAFAMTSKIVIWPLGFRIADGGQNNFIWPPGFFFAPCWWPKSFRRRDWAASRFREEMAKIDKIPAKILG